MICVGDKVNPIKARRFSDIVRHYVDEPLRVDDILDGAYRLSDGRVYDEADIRVSRPLAIEVAIKRNKGEQAATAERLKMNAEHEPSRS